MLQFQPKVTIIGAGAWGSAIGHLFAKHLPNVPLYTRSSSLEEVRSAQVLVLAVPTQAVRSVLEELLPVINTKHFLICCKGIENYTLKMVSQVIEEMVDQPEIAILSGPNFAQEVIDNKISAAVLASKNQSYAQSLINNLASETFRVYYCADVIGVQLAGAVKNVIAIAAGILEALCLGENAKAALITRGLAETARLIKHLGGDTATISGLAGVGDFLLTCGSRTSRNMQFGYLLGKGEGVESALIKLKTVEGYHTALAIEKLAANNALDMPISHAVYNVLYNEADIQHEIQKLLHRPIYSL